MHNSYHVFKHIYTQRLLTLTTLCATKCNKRKKLLHLVALSREQKNHCPSWWILLYWTGCLWKTCRGLRVNETILDEQMSHRLNILPNNIKARFWEKAENSVSVRVLKIEMSITIINVWILTTVLSFFLLLVARKRHLCSVCSVWGIL